LLIRVQVATSIKLTMFRQLLLPLDPNNESIITHSDKLIIIACCCSSLNRPDLLCQLPLSSLVLAQKVGHTTALTFKVKSAIFKISAVVGLGKTINSLAALPNIDLPHTRPSTHAEIQAKAHERFARVYTTQTTKLCASLDASHPQMTDLIQFTYGNILANDAYLSFYETEIALIAAVVMDGGIVEERQGFSHKRALKIGGYSEEVIERLVEFSKSVKRAVLGSSL
jgi:hypothetical protein